MLLRSLLTTFELFVRAVEKEVRTIETRYGKAPLADYDGKSLAEISKAIDEIKAKLELYKKLES